MPNNAEQLKQFDLKMDPAIYDWLSKRSLNEGHSINWIINNILEWEMRDEQWETDDEK